MSDVAITVENLSKQYVLGRRKAPQDALSDALESAARSPLKWLRARAERNREPAERFWAVKDVNFSIKQGEAVGVVGRNGAGKSTLLKLLSRITEPTTGSIRCRGRVASLLEVGTGFHPELSGRENIFLNAAILGMRRTEIARRFDEIVAFSEVERFLDTPVKRYSSGMYVRLAFAVAAHLEPEVLIVDEVLAVGDAAFQKKCLGKMGSVVHEGRTVFLVSHNMAAITALCTRALLFEKGQLAFSGSPPAVVEEYLARSRTAARQRVSERTDRKGEGGMRFSSVSVLNERGEPVSSVASGQDVSICAEYAIPSGQTLTNAIVQIKFFGALGQPLFACSSLSSRADALSLSPGGRLLCRVPRLPLMPGLYTYTIWCTVGGNLEDLVADAGEVAVVEGDYFSTGKLPPRDVGDFLVAHTWSVA